MPYKYEDLSSNSKHHIKQNSKPEAGNQRQGDLGLGYKQAWLNYWHPDS